MGWGLAAGLNVVIALCYVLISTLILLGLLRTKQMSTNALAVATAAIFATCAIHHGHHAVHLLSGFGGGVGEERLISVRAVFGEWHTLLIDGIGAAVAITYLGLRRSYKALLNTPAMFDDAVRVAAEQRLRELAYTDLLTEIPNRAAYQQYADELRRRNQPAAVLFIDLDGFKAINDEYGHDAGDRLLRDVAQRLTRALRGDERLFRNGGDEFVLLGAGHSNEDARAAVRRVTEALAEPLPVRDGEVVVSASVGMASGEAGASVDELLREADAQMYVVKRLRATRNVPAPRSTDRDVARLRS